MTYLIHWAPAQTDLKVLRFADAATAASFLASQPEDRNGCVLEGENDFPTELSKTSLARIYNAISDTPVNTFSNRGAGMQRTWTVLTNKFATLPITSGEQKSKKGTIKMNEVTNSEETATDAATETKSTRVPRPTGPGKAVNEGTSVARILHEALKPHATLAKIAEATEIPEANVLHRIRYVLRVAHGVESTIDKESGSVKVTLPEGFDKKSIFVVKEVKAKAEKPAEDTAAAA